MTNYIDLSTDIIRLTLPFLSMYGDMVRTCKSFRELHGDNDTWKKYYNYKCKLDDEDYEWKGIYEAIKKCNETLTRIYNNNKIVIVKFAGAIDVTFKNVNCRMIKGCFIYTEQIDPNTELRIRQYQNSKEVNTRFVHGMKHIVGGNKYKFIFTVTACSYGLLVVTGSKIYETISRSFTNMIRVTIHKLKCHSLDYNLDYNILYDLLKDKKQMNHMISSDFWLCEEIYSTLFCIKNTIE